ncbi:M4 family metallopeptidase [Streptomyces sp. BR123]|uniref:M4 family metallopeptidase n=1 Tax=Streptomyces sp. BR123 TaxID=2749828 RepID=UPI0015C49916|nr:M4 family metallopeptidase [Streptomyces sp. BR123]NXY97904.1 M4 family metallopeptidase [Streptomyces sp. BR123]
MTESASVRPVRRIFDGRNDSDSPALVRTEGGAPSGDALVDGAYDTLGATWDFFRTVYGRNAIDGRGGPVDAVLRGGEPGAIWQGSRILLGDGVVPLDAVAAQYMIGVIRHTAELESYGQPGALAVSLGNVFGLLAEQYSLKQTAEESDWLFGRGLLPSGEATGSLADPARFGQVAHVSAYDETVGEDGGVHANAGIANRAFHLVATELGGNAWERAGRIWYKGLMGYAARTTNFSAFRFATLGAARELEMPADVVAKAWSAVGVDR